MAADQQNRPVILLLGSHWVAMLGVTLATLAGCFWLIMLPAHLKGHVDNPYIGLLIFIGIPVVFFSGLVLIPIGIVLGRRRFAADAAILPDRRTAWRRLGIFFLVGTVVNVIIASQVSYRAVAYMETGQFCGQSCHVMKPEFTAWRQRAPHQQVACVDCHVEPGAQGWIKSKTAGTRQFMEVVLDSYPRPIPSAIESDKLSLSIDTCEHCHSREIFIGSLLRVSTTYKDDEANTPSYSARMVLVGGGKYGGIHGAHMGPGVRMRYAADKKRQNIPWVEYRNSTTGATRTYLASDAKPNSVASLPAFDFQCVDCHNRAAHSFEIPEKAVDNAITTGQIPSGLPFIKKTGVGLLKAVYQSEEDAGRRIPAGLAAFYQQKYPEVYGKRISDIQSAGQALVAIYQRNVFPDLKIAWGTFPNNLGHTDYLGCFRCHDDSHATEGKKTISQDCGTCHQSLAEDETSPEVLKTLGLAERIASFRKR